MAKQNTPFGKAEHLKQWINQQHIGTKSYTPEPTTEVEEEETESPEEEEEKDPFVSPEEGD